MVQFRILFLALIIMVTGLHTAAQTGSLGDPIFTYDFGSGQNPGPPLGKNPQGNNITNLIYTTDNCPEDGYYTIINSFPPGGACQPTAWHQLTSDHTGNPNGYFMLINASVTPNIFFTYQTPSVLCANTEYQFSAYLLNLITPALAPYSNEPDILFTVTAPDGTVLSTANTGSIPYSAEAAPWMRYSINFNSSGYSYVIVTMTNNAPGGPGNDLAMDDISVSAYGPVINAPEQIGFGQPSTTLCEGDDATYNYSLFQPPGYSKAQWQENVNGAGWADMPGQTSTIDFKIQFNNAKPGVYQYRLGLAVGDNINSPACRIYSPPVTITVNPNNPPVSGLPTELAECEGDFLTLGATGGATYTWTGPNMQPTNNNPLAIPNVTAANTGTYTVTAFSAENCPSPPFSIKVTVYPKAHITATGGGTFCEGVPAALSASGAVSYVWTPGASLSDSTSDTPVATPSDTTTYKVVGTNANGCQDSTMVTVNIIKKPVANAGPDRVIFEGQSVVLNATAQYSNVFSWTPTTGLSDPTILDPVASPASDITYTLQASSSANCGMATSSVFVRVYQHINIPNAFSPNNDGHNDTWDIDALSTYPESAMLVFNRYGQQVFKSTGYAKPWDGTYEGKPVPSGPYYYVLDLKNNKPKISGCVMVVR